MTRLYLTCGLPFAGKTTLAVQLAQHSGWKRISLDDINAERGVGQDNSVITQADWARSYAEAHRRVDATLAAGQTVIYDATNFTRKERDRLRHIAARHNAATTIIYLDIADIARTRWQDNRRNPARRDVGDADYAQVADNFQPPTADENVIIFDRSRPLAEWISNNFKREIA